MHIHADPCGGSWSSLVCIHIVTCMHIHMYTCTYGRKQMTGMFDHNHRHICPCMFLCVQQDYRHLFLLRATWLSSFVSLARNMIIVICFCACNMIIVFCSLAATWLSSFVFVRATWLLSFVLLRDQGLLPAYIHISTCMNIGFWFKEQRNKKPQTLNKDISRIHIYLHAYTCLHACMYMSTSIKMHRMHVHIAEHACVCRTRDTHMKYLTSDCIHRTVCIILIHALHVPYWRMLCMHHIDACSVCIILIHALYASYSYMLCMHHIDACSVCSILMHAL